MNRRDLMKVGAASAAGTLVEGCMPLPRSLDSLGKASPEDFIRMLDEQLPTVDRSKFVSTFAAAASAKKPSPLAPDAQAAIEDKDAVMRRMLRTLLVTQSFRELPKETQVHPAVQERMMSHLEEVGTSVFEVSDMLESMTAAQRIKVQKTLQDQPDLPTAIGDLVNQHAAAAGISAQHRDELNSMLSRTGFRLRHIDPNAMMDEYVSKVKRIRAQTATDAGALDLATKMGERAFWRYQKHLASHTQTTDPDGVPLAPAPSAAPAPVAPPRAGTAGVKAGAYMMGIGAVVFGVSLLLIDVSGGFLIGATVGAVLFSIGFITLIVAGLIYAASA